MAAPAAELHVLRLRRRLALARGDPGPPVTNSLPTLTSPPYGGLVRSQNVSPWCRMAKAWRWIPKRGAGYRSVALDTEAWRWIPKRGTRLGAVGPFRCLSRSRP
jgi:hypothetical protein